MRTCEFARISSLIVAVSECDERVGDRVAGSFGSNEASSPDGSTSGNGRPSPMPLTDGARGETFLMRDEFLSEEDLDLKHLSSAELVRVWVAWLRQAQTTNDRDAHEYSHGVFAGADMVRFFAELKRQTPNDESSSRR